MTGCWPYASDWRRLAQVVKVDARQAGVFQQLVEVAGQVAGMVGAAQVVGNTRLCSTHFSPEFFFRSESIPCQSE
jgi:hypothetical protein